MSVSPIEPHVEGSVLRVRAQASARTNRLEPGPAGTVRARVTAAAEKGKANQAIQRLLAQQSGFRKSRIRLLSGTSSTEKRFLFAGVSPQELASRLQSVLRQQ